MRIADPNPVACSVCLQPPGVRDPQLTYVDCEVAYDGPVITRHGEEIRPETTVRVSIDDLFLCEECLRSAAKLIGMESAERTREEIETLQSRITELESEIPAKDKMISHLEKTVGYAIDHPVKRPGGKPVIHGPDTHKSEITQIRREKVAKERGKRKATV